MKLILPFPWARYSKKLAVRIETPCSSGIFSLEDAKARNVHFASASSGSLSEGNVLTFYWLVDPADGVIIDARFRHLELLHL